MDVNSTYEELMRLICEGAVENPSLAIEIQERIGQQRLVEYNLLPKTVSLFEIQDRAANIAYTKKCYDAMGIKTIFEHDDLFYNAFLPLGWRIESTSHHMWSNVLDDRNRKRMSIFYKASFYDRNTFVRFRHRLDCDVLPKHEDDNYTGAMLAVITDCEKPIHILYKIHEGERSGSYHTTTGYLLRHARSFLAEHFPGWNEPDRYWDVEEFDFGGIGEKYESE